MELPSVLIPYPYAAADHQNKNADAFASVGAAVKVQSSAAKADMFAPMLFSLISSESRINQMKNACVKAAKLNAAADIIDNIIR
ncbi:MAG TPA: glycosyltransferase, partial [Spirochaetota bacterium]|nr:glycosyltransferase [Spirochaetota bacterium]